MCIRDSLLAVLALKEVMARPQLVKEQARSFYISLGLTGGIALLFALAPGLDVYKRQSLNLSLKVLTLNKLFSCQLMHSVYCLRYLS